MITRHGLRVGADRAPGPSFHRQLLEANQVDAIARSPGVRVQRGPGGTRLHIQAPAAPLVGSAPLALSHTSSGLTVTVSAGYLIMRGALIAVAQQSVTLSNGTNVLWMQFAIAPSVTPTVLLQKGSALPTGGTLDLVNYGYWPMSRWTASTSTSIATLDALYHPGGNIPYPVS